MILHLTYWIYFVNLGCTVLTKDMARHQKAACTGEQLELSCAEEPHCRIELQKAAYVHTDKESCDVVSTGCETNATEVSASCRGQHKCVVLVRQERASHICPYISSHLLVDYACNCETCELLHQPKHGKIVYLPRSPDSAEEEVFYECSPGFELVGPSKRKCTNQRTWTGINPACSVPTSVCPASLHPVYTYGDVCLEFISSQVMRWEDAALHCATNNASLIKARDLDELSFVQWKLGQPTSNLYLWIDGGKKTGTDGTCPELIFNFSTKQWMLSKAKCTFRNNFFCRHEYRVTHGSKSSLNMKSFIPGIFVGFIIGTALFTTVICLLNVRRENQKQTLEDEIYQVTGTTPQNVHEGFAQSASITENGSVTVAPSFDVNENYHQEDEYSNDLYDDTCAVDVPHITPNDESVYECTENGQTLGDINKVIDDVIQGHIQHSLENGTYEPNVYENIAVARVADSIRRHLLSSTICETSDDCQIAVPSEVNQRNDSPIIKKPKPAPKPARRKTLTQKENDANQINTDASDKENTQGHMTSDTDIIDNELRKGNSQGLDQPMTEL